WISTLCQSTSNSSARIMARVVLIPCPISDFATIRRTLLSSLTCTHASNGFTGAGFGLAAVGAAAMKSRRKENPITRAVPADAVAVINVRLLTAMAATSRGALNRPANALVGATPANDAGHLIIDLLDGGMRRFRQQRGCSHDLPGLAIPALWDLFVNPRLLQGNLDFLFQSFNRGDIFACHCRNRS